MSEQRSARLDSLLIADVPTVYRGERELREAPMVRACRMQSLTWKAEVVTMVLSAILLACSGCQRGTNAAPKQEAIRPGGEDAGFVVGFGHVDVEGGAVPLNVPLGGRVDRVLVREGQSLEEGQPILTLDCRMAQLAVQQARNLIEKAEIAASEADKATSQYDLQVRRRQAAIKAANANLASRRRELDRMANLLKSGAVGDGSLEALRSSVESLAAMLEGEELALEELRLQDPKSKLQLARLALDDAKSQFEFAQLQLDLHTLKAPARGVVLRIHVAQGQLLGVVPSLPAVWFCPEAPRIVRCEIQQQLAHLVNAGMAVEYRAEMSDRSLGRGTVVRCAEWMAKRRSVLDEPFEVNDVRTLECLTSIETPWEHVRLGERVRVVIDTRSSPAALRVAR